jgi:hypothetical protein
MVAELRRREVGFRSLHEQLDTTTPGGRLATGTPTLLVATWGGSSPGILIPGLARTAAR